jgi:hypothetical protein
MPPSDTVLAVYKYRTYHLSSASPTKIILRPWGFTRLDKQDKCAMRAYALTAGHNTPFEPSAYAMQPDRIC